MDVMKIKKYVPLVLTIGGCLGAVGIAYFSHRDTLKAKEILVNKDIAPETKKEELKQTWKCYIPTGVSTTFTIGCLVGAYILKERQIAALATSLTLTAGLLNEYKDAIRDKLGTDGYEDIVKRIAKPYEDDITQAAPTDITTPTLMSTLYDRPDEGDTLFYDSFLHKWFRASKDAFDLGRYFLNRNYVLGMEVSMKDFYDFMCVPLTKDEEKDFAKIIWSYDECNAFCPWLEWIDIALIDSITDDGEPYYILDYDFCEPECREEVEDAADRQSD